MNHPRRLNPLGTAALLSALSLPGCGPLACTEMGCMSGLTLNVTDADGAPATLVRGTVTVDGTETDFDCAIDDNVAYCGEGGSVLLMVGEGDTVSYSLESPDGSWATGELEPEWSISYPNGEECPPECYNAAADIVLEAPEAAG